MLSLEQVRKSYDGGRTFAVDGIGFHAEAGELVVLVGESGCGKTTTLKMINRLIERSAVSIRVGGQDIDDVAMRNANRRVDIDEISPRAAAEELGRPPTPNLRTKTD